MWGGLNERINNGGREKGRSSFQPFRKLTLATLGAEMGQGLQVGGPVVCYPPSGSSVPLLTVLSVHSPDSPLSAYARGSRVPKVWKMSVGAAYENLGLGSVLRLLQT